MKLNREYVMGKNPQINNLGGSCIHNGKYATINREGWGSIVSRMYITSGVK